MLNIQQITAVSDNCMKYYKRLLVKRLRQIHLDMKLNHGTFECQSDALIGRLNIIISKLLWLFKPGAFTIV